MSLEWGPSGSGSCIRAKLYEKIINPVIGRIYMNMRFWLRTNSGFVKITVSPKRVITWHEFYQTEEGYHSEVQTAWIEDDKVYHRVYTDSQDCDGRTSGTSLYVCPSESLAVREPFNSRYDYTCQGIYLPNWERVSESQRDYAAEAAGY